MALRSWWLVLVALIGTCSQVSAQGPFPVVVDPVRSETIERWRQVTGEVRAVRRALVAAEEEGLVTLVAFDAGDSVEAGDVIATLDDALARISVRSGEAEIQARLAVVAQREAELEETRLDLERVEELRTRGSASPSEYDGARTAVTAANARLDEARAEVALSEANLANARERLSNMEVRAPFAGTVVSRNAEIGQWLDQGEAVVELVESANIEAWLDVPERFAGRVGIEGVDVRVRIDALGLDLLAPVGRVIAEVDPLSRLFSVRVPLDNTGGLLKPGMTAVGEIPTGQDAEHLTVHKDAILRDDAGTFVYLAAPGQAGMQAMPVRVRPLFATGGDRIAVEARRLTTGDRIVVEGNERLFPTAPIAPEPSATSEPAAGG
ncbi:MAG: efflux RND transporter periplasmic adaptor subunit [Planctomycetota bacterium]